MNCECFSFVGTSESLREYRKCEWDENKTHWVESLLLPKEVMDKIELPYFLKWDEPVEFGVALLAQAIRNKDKLIATMTIHEDSSTPPSDITIYNDNLPREKKNDGQPHLSVSLVMTRKEDIEKKINSLVISLRTEALNKIDEYEKRLREMTDEDIEREWKMTFRESV